jgi:hypothetical protein
MSLLLIFYYSHNSFIFINENTFYHYELKIIDPNLINLLLTIEPTLSISNNISTLSKIQFVHILQYFQTYPNQLHLQLLILTKQYFLDDKGSFCPSDTEKLYSLYDLQFLSKELTLLPNEEPPKHILNFVTAKEHSTTRSFECISKNFLQEFTQPLPTLQELALKPICYYFPVLDQTEQAAIIEILHGLPPVNLEKVLQSKIIDLTDDLEETIFYEDHSFE